MKKSLKVPQEFIQILLNETKAESPRNGTLSAQDLVESHWTPKFKEENFVSSLCGYKHNFPH